MRDMAGAVARTPGPQVFDPKALEKKLPFGGGLLALRKKSGAKTVSVVRLEGVIRPGGGPFGRGALNAHNLETPLADAFSASDAVAVALVINSPGGSPAQSALIGDRIRQLSAKHEKPVLAFCEDVAASGGYWLACAADEIFVSSGTVIGSIGVVSSSFGLAEAIEKLGLERRVHTAGTNKSRLDPFLPEKPEDIAWLAEIQTDIHQVFIDWVKERRGPKLVGADNELFNADVWIGKRAVELGVADAVGSLRTVLAERFPDAKPHEVKPKQQLLQRLGLAASVEDIALRALDGAVSAVERRAMWSRFGL
ncbi:MAG: S49 family peptidase [Segniliparus sp.]|uniref:S49 family peptidase n=1 Tax=Segniliparus sp. TaxID=2804064 RepID=UPI003F36CEBE